MENTVALIQMKGLPEFTPLTYGADPAKGTYPFHLFWNCDHVKKAMEGLYIYICIHIYTHHFHKGNSTIKGRVIYYV